MFIAYRFGFAVCRHGIFGIFFKQNMYVPFISYIFCKDHNIKSKARMNILNPNHHIHYIYFLHYFYYYYYYFFVKRQVRKQYYNLYWICIKWELIRVVMYETTFVLDL